MSFEKEPSRYHHNRETMRNKLLRRILARAEQSRDKEEKWKIIQYATLYGASLRTLGKICRR